MARFAVVMLLLVAVAQAGTSSGTATKTPPARKETAKQSSKEAPFRKPGSAFDLMANRATLEKLKKMIEDLGADVMKRVNAEVDELNKMSREITP